LIIDSYRGISNVTLKNLGQINILAGKNNAGKTSILEAIRLLEYPDSADSMINISRMREKGFSMALIRRLDFHDSFRSMFFKQADKIKPISIEGKINEHIVKLSIEGDSERQLINMPERMLDKNLRKELYEHGIIEVEVNCFVGEYHLNIDGMLSRGEVQVHQFIKSLSIDNKNNKKIFQCEYLSSIDHLVQNDFGDLIKSGKKSQVIEVLKIFDVSIIGLDLVDNNVYLEHERLGLMPLSSFGDGMKKALVLATGIIRAQNGILLVDEIETAIHVSALENVFTWFIQACQQYNVQVFATTHSIEVIDALLRRFEHYEEKNEDELRDLDLLRIITLRKDDNSGSTKTRVLSGCEAYSSRMDYQMELR